MCASVYVRAVGALVNHFITGDVGGPYTAGLALDYKALAHTHAGYGEDYVSAVTLLIETIQDVHVINVARHANEQSRKAIKTTLEELNPLAAEWRRQLSASIVTAHALTMEQVMRQLCSSIRYSTTEQYFRCTAPEVDTSGNSFDSLCGPFRKEAHPIVEIFLVEPFKNDDPLDVKGYFNQFKKAIAYHEFDKLRASIAFQLQGSEKKFRKTTLYFRLCALLSYPFCYLVLHCGCILRTFELQRRQYFEPSFV